MNGLSSFGGLGLQPDSRAQKSDDWTFHVLCKQRPTSKRFRCREV